MRKPALIIIAIFVTFLSLIIFVVGRKSPELFLAEADYGDGKHKLRLLQITEGPLDYEWKDPLSGFPLARMLTPGRQRIPSISIHHNGQMQFDGVPGTTFLFRAVDAKGRFAMPGGIPPQIQFVDSAGFVFDEFGDHTHWIWGATHITKSALPRRDKELTIRLVGQDRKTVISEMQVPNPLYQPDYPEWEPEPLPASKTIDGVTCTLKGLNVLEGAKRMNFLHEIEATNHSWNDGQPLNSISADTHLEDATGNVGQWLSPFEKTWKAVILAYPPTTAEFPSERIVRIEKIPVPSYGEIHEIHQKVAIEGREFYVQCVSGGGKVRDSGGKWTGQVDNERTNGVRVSGGSMNAVSFREISHANPFVWIDHGPLPSGRKAFARVNVAGKVQAEGYPGYAMLNSTLILHSGLSIPAGTKEVDLEIIVSEAIRFEFLVDPPAELREEK